MFVPLALVTSDNTYVLLKFVESISEPRRDEALEIIDKLRADVRLSFRTISGKCYTISMQHQISEFKAHNPPTNEQEYCDCIIKRWIDLGNTS